MVSRLSRHLFPVNYTVILSFLYSSLSTFWKSNFLKTTRQNFKVNVYSERELFTLLENVYTIKFCRIVFEKFDFQKVERERYGNGNGYKIESITVFFYFNLVISN